MSSHVSRQAKRALRQIRQESGRHRVRGGITWFHFTLFVTFALGVLLVVYAATALHAGG
jgi:hypothetical protein